MDDTITMPDSLFLPNICSGGYLAQQGLHAQAIVHLLCPICLISCHVLLATFQNVGNLLFELHFLKNCQIMLAHLSNSLSILTYKYSYIIY